MYKIELNTPKVLDALSVIIPITSKSSESENSSLMCISLENGTLSFKATNFRASVIAYISMTIPKEITKRVLIDPKFLKNIISGSETFVLTLEKEKSATKIIIKKNIYDVPSVDGKDFYVIDRIKATKSISIDHQKFLKALKIGGGSAEAVSKDALNSYTSVVNIKFAKKCVQVESATNYYAQILKYKNVCDTDDEVSIKLSKESADIIDKLKAQDNALISSSGDKVEYNIDNFILIFANDYTKFPNIKNLISSTITNISIEVNKQELLAVLNKACLYSSSHIVNVEIGKDSLSILARQKDTDLISSQEISANIVDINPVKVRSFITTGSSFIKILNFSLSDNPKVLFSQNNLPIMIKDTKDDMAYFSFVSVRMP